MGRPRKELKLDLDDRLKVYADKISELQNHAGISIGQGKGNPFGGTPIIFLVLQEKEIEELGRLGLNEDTVLQALGIDESKWAKIKENEKWYLPYKTGYARFKAKIQLLAVQKMESGDVQLIKKGFETIADAGKPTADDGVIRVEITNSDFLKTKIKK